MEELACVASKIQETIPDGSVMLWGCGSLDYKSDLVIVQGNLNGLSEGERCRPSL